ncbi:MAG: hypothetical protein QM493_01250 [Sulfurovum sp.]
MRRISKSTPLPNFNGDNYNNDCFRWTCNKCDEITLHNKYKKIYEKIRLMILIDEQNQLCGYTEIYINELTECHIDHYKKREFFPEQIFDWNNLIVATKDDDFGANFKDNSYRIQEEEYYEIYNPIFDDIPFEYNEWGEIIEEEGKVKKTIEIFNLNCESLKRRRSDIITTIKALKNDGEDLDDIRSSLEYTGFTSVVEQELRNL